jgi:hypothetical protein
MTDENEGQGGSYLLDPATGVRTLVARTQPADAAAQPEQPADAGIFSPVAPAEQPTTTE